MSARLSAAFAKGRPALVTFVTGGDPTPDATPAILDALVEGGADVIELGMPFTDPMADGPAIQAAASTSGSRASASQSANVGTTVRDATSRFRCQIPKRQRLSHSNDCPSCTRVAP